MSSSFQQQPESTRAPRPCAAGCSFFGSPETLGMCSACYKVHCSNANREPSANSASPGAGVCFAPAKSGGVVAVPQAVAAKKKAEPTRCASCYKKVGLVGFLCRCNKTFCGTHRHAEEHGCSFDFKAAGRDAIARSNPIIKGEKLTVRI